MIAALSMATIIISKEDHLYTLGSVKAFVLSFYFERKKRGIALHPALGASFEKHDKL